MSAVAAVLCCNDAWADCRCALPADRCLDVHECACGARWAVGHDGTRTAIVMPPPDGGRLMDLRALYAARKMAERARHAEDLAFRVTYAYGTRATAPDAFRVIDSTIV